MQREINERNQCERIRIKVRKPETVRSRKLQYIQAKGRSPSQRGSEILHITDSLRTLDFIYKVDPRRYRRMHSQMRNLAVKRRADAYPATLAGVYRTASGWTSEDSGSGIQYLADTCFVIKSKDPEKGSVRQVGLVQVQKEAKI